MRVVPISEILNMDVGEKIPSFKGTVKKVYDQSTGKNDKGPWAIQNIELADLGDPHLLIKVKLFNQKNVDKGWVNKTVYIESAQGEKGIKHVTLVQDTYKWKEGTPIKKLVEVKEEAIVGLGDGPAESAAPASAPASTPAAGSAPAPGASAPAAGSGAPAALPGAKAPPPNKTPEELAKQEFTRDKGAVREAREAIARAVNAFELIMAGVDHLADIRKAQGRSMTPEQFHGTCTSIFISLDRAGMVGPLPVKPVSEFLPPKKADAN